MLGRYARIFGLTLACCCLAAISVAAPQKSSTDAILNSLFAMAGFRQVAISPDGTRVAWVAALHNANGTLSVDSGIYIAKMSLPTAPWRVTAGRAGSDDHDIAWSPDGRQMAFLSDAGTPGQAQLYVAPAIGGTARKLTSLTGSVTTLHWSPDGSSLALLYIENAPRKPGPMEPMPASTGVMGGKIYEQRLTTVDVRTGRVRQLSPADLNVYEYDWSPDGKQFVAIAAHGEPDNNWYLAEFFTIDGGSGECKQIYRPPMQVSVPRWSPDGKSIAFVGGLMSDEGITGGDIYLLPAAGGAAKNLTPDSKGSATWFAWRGENEVLFLETVDGETAIATLDASSGLTKVLWRGPETLSALASAATRNLEVSLSHDGQTSAVIRESGSNPQEVWAGPLGAWKQITHDNRGSRPPAGKEESIHWPSDEYSIQGWLTYPRDYDPSRRYPLVVQIHGGPSSVARPRWPLTFFDFTLLSQEGYFVLRPNPRGSYGQGEAFTRANVKELGYGDLRDILAGVDYVVKNYPVDNDRVGIGGWSYGGYMTMWAATQTNRFRASVAGAGIANWQSYYGQNEIPEWVIPFFGASVYDDPEIYARSSPLNFIKKVKTSTLIVVGERDGGCPPAQSLEFWHALQELRIDTQLVIYPGEGHNFIDPEHRRDLMRRVAFWFDRYLK